MRKRVFPYLILSFALIASNQNATQGQKRPQRRQAASLTVKATLSYQFGGTQPVSSAEVLMLDESPEKLMRCPVAVFATASVLNETLDIARLRINAAQARQNGNDFYAEQVEGLLKVTLETKRMRESLAYNKGEVLPSVDESVARIRQTVSSHVVARATTNANGVAVFRGLPIGRKMYLLGTARTRGGVVVWLFEANSTHVGETLALNEGNAIVVF
jgi:hypothetical protein